MYEFQRPDGVIRSRDRQHYGSQRVAFWLDRRILPDQAGIMR